MRKLKWNFFAYYYIFPLNGLLPSMLNIYMLYTEGSYKEIVLNFFENFYFKGTFLRTIEYVWEILNEIFMLILMFLISSLKY